MPAPGFKSIGIRPADRADLESFRGQLIHYLGRFVTVSEAIGIAMRELNGETERIAHEILSREIERVS